MGVVNERSGRGLKISHALCAHSISKNRPLIDPGSAPASAIVEFIRTYHLHYIIQGVYRLLTLYNDDLPAPRCLDVELELWQSGWVHNAEEANVNTPEKALVHVNKDYFPNIRFLMMIMVTIPVTSCECERSISLLRLVKSRLQSTMGAE